MKKTIFITFFILLEFSYLSESANILGLMGVPSPSHHNWNRQLFLALAKKGHNLTVFSPDIDKEATPNLHYIWADKVYSSLYNGSEAMNIMDLVAENPYKAIISLWGGFADITCKGFISSDGFKTLLNYPDDFKFDLVLFDFTCGPCILGFLHKFKYPPVLGMTAFSVPTFIYQYTGGYRQPALIPHFELDYDINMNFFQRLQNHLVTSFEMLYMKYSFIPRMNDHMKEGFKQLSGLPHASELQKKTAVILVNHHFSYETVEPLPQTVIPVGGLQIREPQPLEEKILKFVESSKKGTVLFSLGTNMRSEFMTLEKKNAFLGAFAKFPDFHFVWKYESDLDLQLPKNVMIQPWLKQNDILGHPKTRAFISHCGLLSTQEAFWYGVPVIGIPFFADQFRNVRLIENAGIGVQLTYQTLNQQDLEKALNDVLLNPSFKKKAELKSSLFQDQKDKPIDRAVFWAEWLMRHPNDYKMIQLSRVHDLGWLAANGYDLLIFAGVVIALLFKILGKVFKKIFKNDSNLSKKKKKKE